MPMCVCVSVPRGIGFIFFTFFDISVLLICQFYLWVMDLLYCVRLELNLGLQDRYIMKDDRWILI